MYSPIQIELDKKVGLRNLANSKNKIDFSSQDNQKYYIMFFLFILIWCIGIISPTIFQNEKSFLLAKPLLNQVYSTVCHQQHEKTISIAGENIFVCSRCAGIYMGLLLTSAISLFIVLRIKTFNFLLLTFVLLLLDVILSSFKIYSYSKVFALLTGLLFGSSIFLFAFEEMHYYQSLKKYET